MQHSRALTSHCFHQALEGAEECLQQGVCARLQMLIISCITFNAIQALARGQGSSCLAVVMGTDRSSAQTTRSHLANVQRLGVKLAGSQRNSRRSCHRCGKWNRVRAGMHPDDDMFVFQDKSILVLILLLPASKEEAISSMERRFPLLFR